MNLFLDALAWLLSPERLEGRNALPIRIGEHLFYTGIAVGIAAAIAVPLGYLIGHTGRGRELAVGLSGAARALPSFGLILLLVLVAGVDHRAGAALAAFVLLAVPPLLAGAYAGIESIDRATVDSARAMGMTGRQVLLRVEAPLGLPLLFGGLRAAALQVVATATLAGYVNLGGLGYPILQGLQLRDYSQMLGSALLVVLLALLLDGALALAQRLVVPRGVGRARGARERAHRSGGRGAASMGKRSASDQENRTIETEEQA